ncbi:N-terminal nucleophile aminohydrolase [Sparassis latifolia]|uniref:Probable glutamine amidotransferase n=1 Tax=Sparassis crispa TaxID=139825 RepID=A0A401GSL8_9APHY|nr:Probable glutamine amidotransferase [Sparassis crispa]GBE85231.1 Probable glutamine amidotransferase [Sparassis crispa]
MCRWFAYLSKSEPCLLEDVLIVPAHSLAKQVHDHYLPMLAYYEPDSNARDTDKEIKLRNSLYNLDGLGMAWYTTSRAEFGECDGPHPAVYKVLRQPMNDPAFLSVCANTSTLAVFAHIRAASGGTAITEYNNHPFQFGRWLFMHNGVIAHFSTIKRQLIAEISDEALQLVRGTTDSEHLAALFFTYLEEKKGATAWGTSHTLEDVKHTLEKAISKVLEIQKQVVAQPDASSLNIAITDGTQLLCIRFRNHPTEHPPSLYFSTQAGVALNRKYPGHPDMEWTHNSQTLKDDHEHGEHIIVASEPTTFKKQDWELLKKNECIMVDPNMVLTRSSVEIAY